jgi:hypothetical protein
MDSSGNRSSPVHRQTMKRIYRHSLFAMILLLSSSITMASDVERTKEGAAQLSAPARTNDQGTAKLEIVTGKPAVDRKKSRRSAKSKQRTKEFVRLGLLSAYESGRLHQSKFGATVFDPVSAGRAVDTGGYLNDPFLEKESSSKVIEIKPLDLDFGAFDPFSRRLFQTTDSWPVSSDLRGHSTFRWNYRARDTTVPPKGRVFSRRLRTTVRISPSTDPVSLLLTAIQWIKKRR